MKTRNLVTWLIVIVIVFSFIGFANVSRAAADDPTPVPVSTQEPVEPNDDNNQPAPVASEAPASQPEQVSSPEQVVTQLPVETVATENTGVQDPAAETSPENESNDAEEQKEQQDAQEGDPEDKQTIMQSIKNLISSVFVWIGHSDPPPATPFPNNGSPLLGDDCEKNSDMCQKFSENTLPEPDVNNIVTIPVDTSNGPITTVYIHGGEGTKEDPYVVDGPLCDFSVGKDKYCVSFNDNGTISIQINQCYELVGKKKTCKPAPDISYTLAINGDPTETATEPSVTEPATEPPTETDTATPPTEPSVTEPPTETDTATPPTEPSVTEPPTETDTATPPTEPSVTEPPTETDTATPPVEETETPPSTDPAPTPASIVEIDKGSKNLGWCFWQKDVKVAIFTDTQGNVDVYRFWLNEKYQVTKLINLTDTLPGTVFSPAANGCQVAFTHQDPTTGQIDLYVVSSLGGTPRQITNNAMREGNVDWMNDGRILYEDLDAKVTHLINSDGSGDVILASGSNPVGMPDGTVALSLDGQLRLYRNGLVKLTNQPGTPIAWTYQGIVVIANGALYNYDFTNGAITPITASDYVNQPNTSALLGIKSDDITLNWWNTNDLITQARCPDWYRSDATQSEAAADFFAALP